MKGVSMDIEKFLALIKNRKIKTVDLHGIVENKNSI